MATILIIDDDKSVLNVFYQILVRKGHDVILAEDGQQGLALIDESNPHLVITDIMMQGMNGLELLQQIKKVNKNLPVIAVSGGMRDLPGDVLKQAKLQGVRQIIKKPVMKDVLEKVVESELSQNSGTGNSTI